MTWAPWEVVYHWSPFKIDALGLVTLLGAEEVNSAVGRLVYSSYLEYLPLLGAFVIAGNRFVDKAAGFNLYNISQGIHTTDLAGWLTRWMLSQNFESTRNFVQWTVTPPKSRWGEHLTALIISFIFNGFLIALTVLSKDWYGFTNALSMIISVIVRTYVIGQNRKAIDDMVNKVINEAKLEANTYDGQRRAYEQAKRLKKEARKMTKQGSNGSGNSTSDPKENSNPSTATSQMSQQTTELKSVNTQQRATSPLRTNSTVDKPRPKDFKGDIWPTNNAARLNQSLSKVLIIQSDSKAVTFWMPNALLKPPSVFINGPILLHPGRYLLVRSIGWLVFAVHIVAIGMADLASQLYTVVLLVLPTVLLTLKHGCDDSKWIPTVIHWRQKFYQWCGGKPPSTPDPEAATMTEFKSKRVCYIGSRLRAEIFEWPESYEFLEKKEDGKSEWTNCPIKQDENRERSSKRQELYAWLALTSKEEDSMDKWDLFPHIRDDNMNWWKDYKAKKWALRCNPAFGPQRAPKETLKTSAQATATEDSDEDLHRRMLRHRGATRTELLDFSTLEDREDSPVRKPSIRQPSVILSAFPATNDHLITNPAVQVSSQSPVEHQKSTSASVEGSVVSHGSSRPPSIDGRSPLSGSPIPEE